jgi:hypothetical protein
LKRKLREILLHKEHNEDMRILLIQLHEKDEKDDLFHVTEVPWKVDYEYKLLNFKTDSETPEEIFQHMNDIFFDLLSWSRIMRKVYLINRKAKKSSTKIIKKLKKKSKEDVELENYLRDIQNNDPDYQKKSSILNKKMSMKFEQKELERRVSEYKQTNPTISTAHSKTPSVINIFAKKSDEPVKKRLTTGSVTVFSKSQKSSVLLTGESSRRPTASEMVSNAKLEDEFNLKQRTWVDLPEEKELTEIMKDLGVNK